MRKVLFALIIFVVAFAVPVAVYSFISNSSNFDTGSDAADSSEDSGNVSVPQIISVPGTEVAVDESYSYRVHAVDGDENTLEYKVKKYPAWLSWSSDLFVLEGTPTQDDVGVHRVEIMVSDGKYLKTQTFDIVVEGDAVELDSDEESSAVPVGDEVSDGEREVSDSVEDADEVVADNIEDYNLTPVTQSTVDLSDGAAVLGEADELPNTAIFRGVLGVSLGFAVVMLGLFLWIDARWGFSDRFMKFFQYERGKQIGMDMENGVKVKKRKIRL